MATNTMDAIKKKMQAMKGEKDNALEKADQLEQRVAEQKAINEKVGDCDVSCIKASCLNLRRWLNLTHKNVFKLNNTSGSANGL